MQEPAWPWTLVSLLASAWLLAVLLLTRIVGPLNADEVYFSHTLWLTLHEKRQFLDFYSQHFPTYFVLYDLLIPHDRPGSLSFVWWVRLSNLAVVAAYVLILFGVARRSALFLLPLLLLMAWISRMIEIRADTLGLLAFNAAWAVLLVGKSRWSPCLATALAILGAAFSARGLVMGAGFGVALVWRSWASRDPKALVLPAMLALLTVAAVCAAYLTYPTYAQLMVQSTLIAPSELLSALSPSQRIVAFDRLPQTLLAATSLLLAIISLRGRKEIARAGVIAIACLTQLLLICLDPSPFPYVYAWALVPSLLGLSFAERWFDIDPRKWAAATGAVGASAIGLAVLLYPAITGHAAAPGSNYRLLRDPPLQLTAVQRMPLKELVSTMLAGDQQQSLANQILVREELCRRVRGTVLSAWQSHPICMPDASYYWFSVQWPNIGVGGPSSRPEAWFERVFAQDPPALFIWKVPGASVSLNPWVLGLLDGYEMERGFAVRSESLRRRKVAPIRKPAAGVMAVIEPDEQDGRRVGDHRGAPCDARLTAA